MERSPGTITISMHKNGEQITLLLTDNGVGIGDGPKSPKAGSLGRELMTGLSKEIHGRIAFASGSGTKITTPLSRILHSWKGITLSMDRINRIPVTKESIIFQIIAKFLNFWLILKLILRYFYFIIC